MKSKKKLKIKKVDQQTIVPFEPRKIYPSLLAKIRADDQKLQTAKWTLRFNDFLLTLTGTLALVLIITENSLYFEQDNESSELTEFMRILITLLWTVTIPIVVRRYVLIIRCKRLGYQISYNENLWSMKLYGPLIAELIIWLVHTPPQVYYDVEIHMPSFTSTHSINDVLTFLACGKIYLLIRFWIIEYKYAEYFSALSGFSSLYQVTSFRLKSYFISRPYISTTIFTWILVGIWSFLYYLAERGERDSEKSVQVENFYDSMWLMAMTSLSTGYGDFYPATIVGRTIAVFVWVIQRCLLAILIVVLYFTLQLDREQRFAYNWLYIKNNVTMTQKHALRSIELALTLYAQTWKKQKITIVTQTQFTTEIDSPDHTSAFKIDLPTAKGDWISLNDRASLNATEMMKKLRWILELKSNLRQMRLYKRKALKNLDSDLDILHGLLNIYDVDVKRNRSLMDFVANRTWIRKFNMIQQRYDALTFGVEQYKQVALRNLVKFNKSHEVLLRPINRTRANLPSISAIQTSSPKSKAKIETTDDSKILKENSDELEIAKLKSPSTESAEKISPKSKSPQSAASKIKTDSENESRHHTADRYGELESKSTITFLPSPKSEQKSDLQVPNSTDLAENIEDEDRPEQKVRESQELPTEINELSEPSERSAEPEKKAVENPLEEIFTQQELSIEIIEPSDSSPRSIQPTAETLEQILGEETYLNEAGMLQLPSELRESSEPSLRSFQPEQSAIELMKDDKTTPERATLPLEQAKVLPEPVEPPLTSVSPTHTNIEQPQATQSPEQNSIKPKPLKRKIAVPRFSMKDAVNIANVLETADKRHNRYVESRKQNFQSHITKTKKQMKQEYSKVMGRLDSINEMLSQMIKK